MTYRVIYANLYRQFCLGRGYDLPTAIAKANEALERHKNTYDEGIGQSIRVEDWQPNLPYQIVVRTMTAEAGEVLDIFAVEEE